ncbi:EAL domain-containing protein [Ralstonia pseudosolanacearum]|uniref:Probable signal transduction protein eal-ggdef domains n=3 Tax=Ralstonia pseudosolanacearum TaxID=1310165 RepID=Q8Y1V1_RALN1|nr:MULTISPECIES: EAL domain-containing protein [Ralstonia]APF88089.1 diguanylate cyclase [Ralstonia solanacearum FJAT-1458]ARS55180.1 diguanylate cyclase [Ralstonia solanacearum FJAT-91]AXV70302.1 bifunctional diguanylate cyclase/phosphodiesterase [Ralstonia solanacearum]AST26262.1 bifunctional diguanylate cyclase/phosphodiesterase [Ralstonia pseudosolanacearum]AXV96788.1 bifunctional diguanylate cyclase/phosphodiesterase [Ralstonia solanacearum]
MDATSTGRPGSPGTPEESAARPLPLADDRYEALVRQMPDALYIVADDIIVFINEAGVRLLGADSASDIVGRELDAFVHEDSVQLARQRREWMIEHGAGLPPVEQTLLRCDGTPVDVEILSAPVQLGWRTAVQVVARDIRQRKHAEQALRESEANYRALAAETARAKELLRCEKTVLEMSSRNVPLPDLLAEVCHIVDTLLDDGAMCSILLCGDGEHVTLAAAPSLPSALSKALVGLTIGPAAGSCGTAMFRNARVVVEDIETDPLWDDYRALVVPMGLRACWSTPIRGDNAQMIGAVGVYYDTPRAPTRPAMQLLDDITDIVGVAVQKAHIARELQESEERYRLAVDNLTEGILVQAADGTILACNPSARRILRAGDQSPVGASHLTLMRRSLREDGSEIPFLERPTRVVLTTGRPLLGLTIGLELINGDVVWVYENVLPIMRPGDATPSAVLISFNDIGPARAAEQQLKFLAQRDALTGLYNRAYFLQRMQAVLDEAVTDGRQAAVLFLDLDGFKKVNDTAGHEAGDHLLRIVAQRLSACVRQTDTLARLGGDEFVVLLDQVRSLAEAEQLARRIIAAIAQPFSTGGTEYYLGASIGIAVHPDHGQDAATLLRCADAAMYNAKQNGRNQHRVFTAQLSQRAQRRFQLEQHLRRALSAQELSLRFQPIVDAASMGIVGAEVLLRWHSAELGEVSPAEFIPVAEDAGLIIAIGEWVLEQACRQAAHWRRTCAPDFFIAVNLSPRQFGDALVPMLSRCLAESGLPACALEMEITEGLLMRDTAAVMPVLDALTALGVRISIDDFGTGYSSLSYLQRFPIDNLKVDRSFVSGIPRHRDSVVISRAVVAMAASLDMTVTAEGVETLAQAEFLQAAGCDKLQGFLFGAPMSAAAYEERLRRAQLGGPA